jgi:DNA-binding XRE family transcriptional regulator
MKFMIPFEGRAQVSHRWDTEDTRLLYLQTVPFRASCEFVRSSCVVQPLFVADNLEIDEQSMIQIEQGKILAAVKLPRVFFHPMRAGITDPPQFEDSDHAHECASLFDQSPFARRLNWRKKRRKMSVKTTVR